MRYLGELREIDIHFDVLGVVVGLPRHWVHPLPHRLESDILLKGDLFSEMLELLPKAILKLVVGQLRLPEHRASPILVHLWQVLLEIEIIDQS